MRKLTLALAAASLLFTLNSAVVARASTPQPLWVGTNVAQLAEQAPIHWVSVAQIENRFLARAKNLLSRQRGLPEKPAVLGKNEQWLG